MVREAEVRVRNGRSGRRVNVRGGGFIGDQVLFSWLGVCSEGVGLMLGLVDSSRWTLG